MDRRWPWSRNKYSRGVRILPSADKPDTTKICYDCVHCERTFGHCRNALPFKEEKSLVNGGITLIPKRKVKDSDRLDFQRSTKGLCGPSGRHFERAQG